MEKSQVLLVQESFAKLTPLSSTAAAVFYSRLFELDSSLKPLFRGNLQQQGNKLMKVIGMAVHSLNDLNSLMPVIRSLGQRHVSYGIADKDYDTVGQALLWSLKHCLGEEFTEEVREAWNSTYHTLSTVMRQAASTIAA